MEDQNPARIKEIKKLLNLSKVEINLLALKGKFTKTNRLQLEKKIIPSLLKSQNETAFIRKLKLRDEFQKTFINLSEIKELPRFILKLGFFNSYESCHLLVHEKGKPIGKNYFFNQPNFEENKSISTQSFSGLFNLIKKSKNKIFNQAPNLKDDLEIVGNFLAKEIELKKYSVIYLISRNSFLPPSEDEQLYFQILSGYLQPLLMRILNKEQSNFKRDILVKSLEKFPDKITIKKNNQIFFSNNFKMQEADNWPTMVFPIEDESNTILELATANIETISTQFYHSQRISLLGELLNTLQHELSNPLFGLNLTGTLLSSETENTEIKETLNDICLNANRSQTIIKNFSNLYDNFQDFKRISLYSFIEEVVTLTKSETKEIKKNITSEGFENIDLIVIESNPTYLTQIIFNLIINSAQAIKSVSDRTLKNSITIKLIKINQTVSIAISDDGPGVSPEHADAIFRPFFTTKDSGTGLGLAICQNLAIQLSTKIQFQNNSPFPGATFSINLPLIQG